MVKTRSGAGVDVDPNRGKEFFSLTPPSRSYTTQVPFGGPLQNLPLCLQVSLDSQQPVPQIPLLVSQVVSQLGPQPFSQLDSQLVSVSASQPVSQPGPQPVSQLDSQLVSSSVSQPESQPGPQPVAQPDSQLTLVSVSQPDSQLDLQTDSISVSQFAVRTGQHLFHN